MNTRQALASLAAGMLLWSCAGVKSNSGTGGSSGTGGTTGGGAGGSAGTAPRTGGAGGGIVGGLHDCRNLECQQTMCLFTKCLVPSCGELQKAETTLSGTVYDPAGKVPLYNVVVYVPNAPLDPIPEGVSCGQCAGTASGKPIASALTDATGKFLLKNPPVGTNIPLVLQVGKWRREVVIPSIAPCQDNVLTDVNLTRLPKNQAEGHIPLIAVTTGHSDALECLLRKIGIADEEFTTETGSGRIHMFVGEIDDPAKGSGANRLASGTMFPAASTLWGNMTKLLKYDIMVLSCEGGQLPEKKMPYLGFVKAYADLGGRIFVDHLHFGWILRGLPPWPATAAWIGVGTDLPSPISASIDTTFPKGMAFSEWLSFVKASPAPGKIDIIMGQHSVDDDVMGISQRWIYTDTPKSVQYLTFNTPVEAAEAEQCGRIVFTDIHVTSAGGDISDDGTPFPNGCTAPNSSAQEKALEFMFFDLSSCIQNDMRKPEPPIIVP